MKLIIEIPEKLRETVLKEDGALWHLRPDEEYDLVEAIKNGTPIPNNATNGDVIKLLFQDDDLGIEVIEGNIRFNLGDDWWNAPYKAESEDKEC